MEWSAGEVLDLRIDLSSEHRGVCGRKWVRGGVCAEQGTTFSVWLWAGLNHGASPGGTEIHARITFVQIT